MQVLMNCKKNNAIDYDGDYRTEFKERIESAATRGADFAMGDNGTFVVTPNAMKDGKKQNLTFEPSNTLGVTTYVSPDKTYAEIIFTNDTKDKTFSFVICPKDDNEDIGTTGVLEFIENITKHASEADVAIVEYVDPNTLGICPDDVDNMEELQAKYDKEMANTVNEAEELSEAIETDDDLEDELLQEQAKASQVVSSAIAGLESMKQELIEEKRRRVAEMISFHKTADEQFDAALADDEGQIAEIVENTMSAIDNPEVIDVPEEAEDLVAQRARLMDVSADVNNQLDEYDAFLKSSRNDQKEFESRLDSMEDPSGDMITELLGLLNEQTEHNELLNEAIKKERSRHQHHLEQLEEANRKISELKAEHDETQRRLHFSQENQRKAEKFVRDARSGVSKVIANADKKLDQAIQKIEDMRKQVEEAKAEAAAANKHADEMESERDSAIAARDTAFDNLEKEKEHAARLVEEFGKQLDEFTDETVAKIKSQIERADIAERNFAGATKRISEVENELADVRNQLMASEAKLSKKDIDLKETTKKLSEQKAQCGDLEGRLRSAVDENAAIEIRLSEMEHDYNGIVSERDKLSESIQLAYEERDKAISNRITAVEQAEREKNEGIARAYADRDESVNAIISSKDSAIQANDQIMAALASVAAMPSTFGSRKAKLDAFEKAYNEFLTQQQNAVSEAENVVTDMVSNLDLETFLSENVE